MIGLAQRDPRRAKELIERRDLKVPIFVQGSIHGNEYEGVDAVMRTIERLATTAYGADAQVDAWLDHAVLVFNVIQNPDGRIAGTRANGNGFDLNRDYITQSQPETVASVGVIREWFPTAVYDLHGYVDADARRGHHDPAQPGHRVRPVDEVEPAAHGRQPGRAGQRGLRDQPADRQHPGRRPRERLDPRRARRCRRAGTTGARSTRASTASCAASTR